MVEGNKHTHIHTHTHTHTQWHCRWNKNNLMLGEKHKSIITLAKNITLLFRPVIHKKEI